MDIVAEEETGRPDTREDAERPLQSSFDKSSRGGEGPLREYAVSEMFSLGEREEGEVCPACAGKGEFLCTTCYGTGRDALKICSNCEGEGRKKCPVCNGSGKF